VKRQSVSEGPGTPGVQLGESAVRTMVLEGGAAVLAEHGVRPASVELILKAARISRRTFYRFYDGKEDVLMELYRLCTEDLLESCRLSLAEETAPLRQIERCIDAHLASARGPGRLLFVLGGEAQHQESPLHARRTEVHEELTAMLCRMPLTRRIDPLLLRAVILALEGVTRLVLAEGDQGRNVSEVALKRARRTMMRIATAALAGKGPGVTRLPRTP
jgi:AcrR family transcriptional regulator